MPRLSKSMWLKRCSTELRRKYCKRFVDDISVHFEKLEHLQQFTTYENKQHYTKNEVFHLGFFQ